MGARAPKTGDDRRLRACLRRARPGRMDAGAERRRGVRRAGARPRRGVHHRPRGRAALGAGRGVAAPRDAGLPGPAPGHARRGPAARPAPRRAHARGAGGGGLQRRPDRGHAAGGGGGVSDPAKAAPAPGRALSQDLGADGVLVVTLDVPGERVNTLGRPVMEEVDALISEIEARPEVKGVVLRSGKADNFIAGADIKELTAARRAALDLADGTRRPERPGIGLRERLIRPLIFGKARSSVMAKTHGHYPAPLAAIDAVQRGTATSFAEGLKIEARRFGELA